MARESCIMHPSKQAMAIVRQDYYELTGDACAAALLNIFEYWANGAIASDGSIDERPWVGARPIREFEQMLLGISTDKQIRKRLALLENRGFIQTKSPNKRGAAKEYRIMLPEIQQALFGQMTGDAPELRLFDLPSFGQTTDSDRDLWLNNQQPLGQITNTSSVKQPKHLRSNNRALKKKTQEFKKEDLKEDIFCSSKPNEISTEQARLEQRETQLPVQIGEVRYSQQPETIDFSELWVTHPGLAQSQLRAIAPGHKRIEMVAHGLGQWWIGPGLNDFDEWLIKACQQRKRKFQQPDSESDAKTFINNMIRAEDWGNLSLRCEEAEAIKEKATRPATVLQAQAAGVSHNPFERTDTERRDSAIGLARFKLVRGQVAEAIALSQRFNFKLPGYGDLSEKASAALAA